MKRCFSFLIISVIIISLFTGCKKEKGDPPALPPAGSMEIDFSNFESTTKGDETTPGIKGSQISNWELAASAALSCKALIYLPLAVPVYSFRQASSQKAVYIDDKTWQWSAGATLLNVTYNVRLTGQITASNVVWKMYITKPGTGGYTDFLWFEGTSETDGSSGEWILYESPQNQVKIVEIDWAVTGINLGSVRYTYVKSGAFTNSFIEYGLTAGELNAYYKIYYYNSLYETFFDMNVEWIKSSTHRKGRVSCLKYFGIPDWNCWNDNLLNINCSQL